MSSRPALSEAILDAKRDLRRNQRKLRAGLADTGAAASSALADRFLATWTPTAGQVVSAFWPLGDEIDARPLMVALHRLGLAIALPVMQGAGRPLLFRAWTPGLVLQAAGFGTQEPDPEQATLIPDLLAVPLLAFDRAGYRLGYGGGFYDRSLAELRASKTVTAIGLAFAAQEVAAVPHDDYDQPLDGIVTEREAIRFARAA